MNSLSKKLLGLCAVALAACNVSASGQIPCADDSSCPADYPVCSAGKCVEAPAGTTTGLSVSILGVPGKAATDPLKGTVKFQVVAKAASGVKTLTLDAGGKSYTPDADSAAPVFNFTVDTTKLTDGSVSFTATLTPGDSAQAAKTSDAFAVTVDNTAPTLTIGVVGSTEVTDGTLVAIDVTSTETLASITGSVSESGTALAQIAAPTGTTYHFGYAVSASDAAGAHTVSVTATDAAGNTGSNSLGSAFSVHHPFAFGALSVSTGHTVNEVAGALPAATAGTVVTASVTLPASASLGTNKPVFKITPAGSSTAKSMAAATVTTGSTSNTWTSTYTVVSGDADGIAAVTVSVTDPAGNTPTPGGASVAIDKAAPVASGIIGGGTFDTVHHSPEFSFVSNKRLQSAAISSSNGDAGSCTCDGGACTAATSTTPLVDCVLSVTHASAASPTVTFAIKDTLGNTSPATAAYQSSYAVVAAPSNGGVAGTTTIGQGATATLTPTFSGGVGVISGTDGSSYAATTGVGITVSPNVTTTYSMVVTNAAGTTATGTAAVVTVVPPANISSFVGPSYYAAGGSVSALRAVFGPSGASATVTGTDGVSNYTCSPATSTTSPQSFTCPNPTNGLDVTYTLTVTFGPATTTATLTVKVAPDPASSIAFSVNGTNPINPGGNTTLTGTVCNGCTYTISPSTAIASSSLSGTALTAATNAIAQTTTLTLTVTDQAGVSASANATINVNQPTVTSFTGPAWSTTGAGGIALVAAFGGGSGASAAVTATAGTTSSSCGSASTSSPHTFTCTAITADTTFTLTVTLGSGANSTTTSSLVVKVAPNPSSGITFSAGAAVNPGSSASLSGTFCSGCTATVDPGGLVATPAGGFTLSPTVQATTTFTLTVTNQAGATATATATQTVNAPAISSFTGPTWSTTGAGNTISLVAAFGGGSGASAAVSASPGGATCGASSTVSPHTFTCTGITADTTYTLTVTLGSGANSTTSSNLTVKVAPSPSTGITFSAGAAVNPGTSASLSGTFCSGCTATVDPGGLTASPSGGFTLSPALTATTTYTLTVTNQAGATATATATQTVNTPAITSFTGPTWSTTGAGNTLSLVAQFGGGSGASAAVSASPGGATCGASSTVSPHTFTCTGITADTTYTLTVTLGTGANSTTSSNLTVKVAPDPSSGITFNAGAAVNPGTAGSLSGSFCTGCTGVVNPGNLTASPAGGFTLSPALTATTTYTLTVTNQAGATAQATATQTVNTPAINSFTGPTWSTTGAGNTLSLVAQFGGGSGASAAVSASPGGATCGASSTVSPHTFTCTGITADTTYTLTVTLGTGTNSTTTHNLTVKVAPDPSSGITFSAGSAVNPGTAASLSGSFCTGCTGVVNPGNLTASPAGGFTLSPALTATTTYTLTVTNQAGATAQATATQTVNTPAINSFTGPTWSTTGAGNTLSLVAQFGGGSGASAAVSASPGGATCGASSTVSPHTFTCTGITADTTYTLTVTLGTGTNSTTTSGLTVKVAPDPSSGITFSAGAAVNPGTTGSLSGSFCTGCTGVVNPGNLTASPAGGFTLSPALTATTTYTLTVTNQAGSTGQATATQTVNKPTVTAFTGPASWTAGKGSIPLSATFGGGSGASASVAATAGSTGSTCSPASTTTSPAAFTCSAITQDTTYTLTVTLGTGTNSQITETLVVKVAPTRSTTGANTMAARFGAAIALLPNGKLLIAGGSTTANGSGAVDTALVYDPSTTTFVSAGQGVGCAGNNIKMGDKRFLGTATLLPSGKVLLAGGSTDGTAANAKNSVDLYDFNADCFAGNSGATHLLQTARFQDTATALPNGQVLIAGGTGTGATVLTSGELYDPTTNVFSPIAGAMTARTLHTATLMNNGVVLLAGGTGTATKGDLFDYTAPTAFTQTTGNMQAARSFHTATLLGSGAVLLAGGSSDGTAANANQSAELYLPTTSTFSPIVNTLTTKRYQHTATLLPSGAVLIAGGSDATAAPLSSTEVFDPTASSFSAAAAMSATRTMGVAEFLFNGSALVTGGNTGTIAGDLFTP